MTASLRALLSGLVDYAGLFPPAKLPMEQAVRKYGQYRRGEHAWALGRFIVPVARLDEVPEEYPVSVLVDDLAAIPSEIDVIEVKASSAADVARIAKAAGERMTYVEVKEVALIEAIAKHHLRAKIRTGGITNDAFPDAAAVIEFINTCMAFGVPFKATAGLHHPVRCVKPLTYEPDAPTGTMHGFVNLFLAAAFLDAGADEELATELLLDDDPESFSFSDVAAFWRDYSVETPSLAETRRERAISFGSCSFEEPIADMKELGWL